MRTLIQYVLISSVAVTVGACRRDPGPSLEYVEAKGVHDRLLVDHGDEAYTQPRMAEVEALLRKVDPRSSDAAAAKELLATIASERQRVEQEAAQEEEAPPDLSAAFEAEEEPEDQDSAEAAAEEGGADAGVALEQPQSGMEEAEFVRKFSRCFRRGDEVMVQGLGLRQTFTLNDTTECRTRHRELVGLAVIISDAKVAGFAKVSANAPGGGAPPAPQRTPPQAPQAPSARAPYTPPAPPETDPDITRPETTPASPGTTQESYDSIKY